MQRRKWHVPVVGPIKCKAIIALALLRLNEPWLASGRISVRDKSIFWESVVEGRKRKEVAAQFGLTYTSISIIREKVRDRLMRNAIRMVDLVNEYDTLGDAPEEQYTVTLDDIAKLTHCSGICWFEDEQRMREGIRNPTKSIYQTEDYV